MSSPAAADTPGKLAAVAPLLCGLGGLGRRRLIDETGAQLLGDLLQIVRLRLEVACVRPLECGFQRTSDLPVSVAQMVIDRRILGLELDRALELLHRFL